jgi:archaellum biogenesis protein FlaJ (TadC family)
MTQLAAALIAATLLAVVLVMAGTLVDDLRHRLRTDTAGYRAGVRALLVAGALLAVVLAGQLVELRAAL